MNRFARVGAGTGPSRLQTECFEEQRQAIGNPAITRVEPAQHFIPGRLVRGKLEHVTVLLDGLRDATGRRIGSAKIDPREAIVGLDMGDRSSGQQPAAGRPRRNRR